jgi:hypothetical protein
VEVFKKKHSILFSGILARRFVLPFRIGAREWVVEKMPMVILSVRVARQSEESRNRDNEDGGAVKRIDISCDGRNGITDQGITANRQNQDKTPKSPICLN